MLRESVIQNQIRCALSSADSIVLRLNSGKFYAGKVVYSQEFKQPVLINLRMVEGCPEGTSDLMYLGKGRTAFIECKTDTGKVKPAQTNFINRMRSLGHRAGIARSVEDALKIVEGK